MILILDACTILNLVNVYQDDRLLKLLRNCFKEIYIASEVIAEVDDNKSAYSHLYESPDTLKQLFTELKLREYLSDLDKDKIECFKFAKNFAKIKHLEFREADGEFHSTLLSLYLSRWGKTSFVENNNKILFATDDEGAKELYQNMFYTNQIGAIIDSIDIVCILYLKSLLSKALALSCIEGIIALYNSELDSVIKEIEIVRKKESNSAKNQINLTTLMEYVRAIQVAEVERISLTNNYKKLYDDHPALKSSVKNFTKNTLGPKFQYLKIRHDEIRNDLLWVV